jgi:hypothetical protein
MGRDQWQALAPRCGQTCILGITLDFTVLSRFAHLQGYLAHSGVAELAEPAGLADSRCGIKNRLINH